MNRLLVTALVVFVACTAHAGGNPDARIYIDFDPPNYVHAFQPELYTMVNAYVCLDQIGSGMESIAFRLNDLQADYPGMCGTLSFTVLLPGLHPITNIPWWDPGVTLTSAECMTDEPVVIGCTIFFYLGGSGCLKLRDHLEYPRWVVDCSEPYGEVDQYCVLAHGTIGDATCPEGDCAPVPVEHQTWGTIKSLYR